MAFVGAQDQTHRRILVRVGPMLFGIVAVHMHLPHIGMGQVAQLQVDDDQAAQLAMEQQQIDPIPGLVDTQAPLPPDEGDGGEPPDGAAGCRVAAKRAGEHAASA